MIGLVTQPRVAIDGSKFKAVNNRDKNFTRAKMERRMAQIEESVARYLQQLDTACGFKLANDGVDTRALQAYLGHRNIQHTVRYTELAPTRFKNFWRDRAARQTDRKVAGAFLGLGVINSARTAPMHGALVHGWYSMKKEG